MKKLTSFLNLLAISLVLSAGVSPANAGLAGFSPNPAVFTNPGGAVVTIGGMPAWFQDQNGVAVQPCLDIARCGLGLVPPLVYPTNFPDEFFYFAADAEVTLGTSSALVVMALEIVFQDALGNPALPTTPGAVAAPFQRLRVVHTSPGGAGATPAGNFTIRTPWGVTTYAANSPLNRCVNQGGNTKCTFTRDIFSAPPNFIPALGAAVVAPDSAISTFLRDPAATVGFLGTGGGAASYTGGVLGNSVTVTDPFGNTGTTPLLSLLMGQTAGLEITPPVLGNDFGVMKPANPVPVTKTFTVNNLTGAVVGLTVPPAAAAPLTFTPRVSNAITSAVSPDFTIAATPLAALVAPATKACAIGAGATMAIGEVCNFDVIFNPTTADGAKTSTVFITGAGAPAAQVTVTGIADATPPILTVTPISFANVATPTISGTASDANGIASVSITVGAAAPVTATITPGVAGAPSTWSKVVTLPNLNAANTITVTAADNAQTGGNIAAAPAFTITHDNIKPTVNPTIAPAKNDGGFITTASPTLTPGVLDANPIISTIVTVDTTVPSTNVTPATLPLGPLGEGSHTVKIDALDAASNPGTASIAFNVDSIKPVITITSPVITAAGTIGTSSPSMTFTIDDVNPSQRDLNPSLNPGAPLPAAGTPGTTATLDSLSAPGVAVPLHHPIAFTTDALGKVTGTITLVDPNIANPDLVPLLNVGETHTVTIDTTDLAGNVATQKKVTFALLFKDGSMTTLGATPPTIADVILALKVALGGFPEVANITPTTDKFKHGDVGLVNGVATADGKIDLSDVLTILKKVAGLITF